MLRLLDATVPTLQPLIAEHGCLELTPATSDSATTHATWDAALGETRLADLLRKPATATATDSTAISAGLVQLNRYMSRVWQRSGISPQQHDDCTQAVYERMLRHLGRDRFDGLVGQVGRSGIKRVLSRETAEGPEFFRAIDMMKKRAQREPNLLSLDEQSDHVAMLGSDGAAETWSGALREAIDQSLNPREAALIHATLKGFSPAEIAHQWGMAPKTVSNEKTRVIQKLRAALVADLED